MISVVSPVFNSEKTIKKFIITLTKYLKRTHQKYEIILINDNSDDNSKKIINKIQKKKIVLINLKKNLGQHKALYEGLKITKGNTIITMDSDLQDCPSYIPKLYTLHKVRKEIFMVSLKKNIYKKLGYLFSFLFWNIFFFYFTKKKILYSFKLFNFFKKKLRRFF